MILESHSVEETKKIVVNLFNKLEHPRNYVFALYGGFDEGKTTISSAIIIDCLKLDRFFIPSPAKRTYRYYKDLKNSYGYNSCMHIDAYKVDSYLKYMAKESPFRGSFITIVEHADKVEHELPKDGRTIRIKIRHKDNIDPYDSTCYNKRLIEIPDNFS